MFFKKSPTPTLDGRNTFPDKTPAKWVLEGIYERYNENGVMVSISVEDNSVGRYVIKDSIIKLIPANHEVFNFNAKSREEGQAIANELIELHNKGLE